MSYEVTLTIGITNSCYILDAAGQVAIDKPGLQLLFQQRQTPLRSTVRREV